MLPLISEADLVCHIARYKLSMTFSSIPGDRTVGIVCSLWRAKGRERSGKLEVSNFRKVCLVTLKPSFLGA
jgi:hypothetical protein